MTKYASQKYTFSPSDVFFQSSSKQCIFIVVTGRHLCCPVNTFVVQSLKYCVTGRHSFFCYATVEISRIHTTLEILLLLQTKVTKHCYHQMRFLGSNATEMRWRLGLCPRLCWGSLQCSHRHTAGFEGAALWQGKERRGGN